MSETLVSRDELFSAAALLRLCVARHAGRLPLLAAPDSGPGNDQQTAVTRGQKSPLTRACLTLLAQAISSLHHARLTGLFSTSTGNTCTHMSARVKEDTLANGGACLSVLPVIFLSAGLLYLIAIYTIHDERNDFVCYSKVLQHRMHFGVCREIREKIQYKQYTLTGFVFHICSNICGDLQMLHAGLHNENVHVCL